MDKHTKEPLHFHVLSYDKNKTLIGARIISVKEYAHAEKFAATMLNDDDVEVCELQPANLLYITPIAITSDEPDKQEKCKTHMRANYLRDTGQLQSTHKWEFCPRLGIMMACSICHLRNSCNKPRNKKR